MLAAPSPQRVLALSTEGRGRSLKLKPKDTQTSSHLREKNGIKENQSRV